MPAQGSIVVNYATNASSVYSCEIVATIYANGAVAGDQGAVTALLARRAREEAQHQLVINHLTLLGASPSMRDLARAAMAFDRRGRAWERQGLGGALHVGDAPLSFPDRVYLAAAAFLRRMRKLEKSDPAKVAQSLRVEIARQQAALSALQLSLPHPPQ